MKILLFCVALVMTSGAIPVRAQAPSASASMQELAWPQNFDVQGQQARSVGFAVTQPGLLVVSVQAQGAPVTVSVRGPLPNPLPQPAPQSGPGGLQFVYNLSAQDVQRGTFWLIEVRLLPAAATQPGARAIGTIAIQRPPVNQALVQQAVQSAIAQRHTSTQPEQAQAAAQMKAQMDGAFNTRRAQFAQHVAQRQAAVMMQLQPALEAIRRQKAVELGNVPPPPATPAIGGSGQIKSRGLDPQIRRIALPLPAPVITTMAIANNQDSIPLAPGSYGQPGDEVTLTGTNFGSTDGEVHFIIGPLPTQDMIVSSNNQLWIDKQIVAPVPIVSGLMPFAGAVYVRRRSDGAKSIPVAFQFEPNVEQREIRVLADTVLQQIGGVQVLLKSTTVERINNNLFSGVTGLDRLFLNSTLRNGWRMVGQPVPYYLSGSPPIGLITTAPGTDRLSLIVVFAVSPGIGSIPAYVGYLGYGVAVPIQGPSGVPDGFVCVTAPPAGQMCPSTDNP